jgi:hypothetical protein
MTWHICSHSAVVQAVQPSIAGGDTLLSTHLLNHSTDDQSPTCNHSHLKKLHQGAFHQGLLTTNTPHSSNAGHDKAGLMNAQIRCGMHAQL